MNKAFTKEDEGPQADRLDDLPQSPHPNYVTPAGLVRLQQQLRDRHADLSALPRDSLAAKVPRAMAERDIRFLEGRINRAIPVDPAAQDADAVAFGASVTVLDDEDRQTEWRIVGEDEADPAQHRIAPFSPLAQALMGARVGDVVDWRKPGGVAELKIVAIRYST
ncbi:Transcription elongation factor, GreA/GreB family [Loktanella fryxellensis]|uniref:Transcription elongation factor, GreA/GreB family n=1 Tax=Loktanella fryxellensis TaxID=245187 RepID=A0A1H7ZSV9_9RHOB|nr:GreA/GreB family elongation factor [Loktanella fryxellensis]SEM61391.1 Transcription elongation factor, GreA/GreB family [Loktanella fryxellensis]